MVPLPALADLRIRLRVLAAWRTRVVRKIIRPERARGMPDASAHPQPCVRNEKAHKHSHYGRAGITRHSRTRMVLTVSFALSPGTGLSCPRRLVDHPTKLDASVGASGPHDFAVRLTRHSSKAPPRPPHPAPTSVTIAIRPSCGTGCAEFAGDLGSQPSEIFFAGGLDHPNQPEAIGEIEFSAPVLGVVWRFGIS